MEIPTPTKLAVLISGSGTTLANLIDTIGRGELACQINLVIASRQQIKGCDIARSAGLPLVVVDPKAFSSGGEFSKAVFSQIDRAGVDLVCLGGLLCKLEIPKRWEGKVLNIHPSLLPKFGGKGMYGSHVHRAVIQAGELETGCTVHLVNDEYDSGPIILQEKCAVTTQDTPESLAARVFELEKRAYPEAIRRLQQR